MGVRCDAGGGAGGEGMGATCESPCRGGGGGGIGGTGLLRPPTVSRLRANTRRGMYSCGPERNAKLGEEEETESWMGLLPSKWNTDQIYAWRRDPDYGMWSDYGRTGPG